MKCSSCGMPSAREECLTCITDRLFAKAKRDWLTGDGYDEEHQHKREDRDYLDWQQDKREHGF